MNFLVKKVLDRIKSECTLPNGRWDMDAAKNILETSGLPFYAFPFVTKTINITTKVGTEKYDFPSKNILQKNSPVIGVSTDVGTFGADAVQNYTDECLPIVNDQVFAGSHMILKRNTSDTVFRSLPLRSIYNHTVNSHQGMHRLFCESIDLANSSILVKLPSTLTAGAGNVLVADEQFEITFYYLDMEF